MHMAQQLRGEADGVPKIRCLEAGALHTRVSLTAESDRRWQSQGHAGHGGRGLSEQPNLCSSQFRSELRISAARGRVRPHRDESDEEGAPQFHAQEVIPP